MEIRIPMKFQQRRANMRTLVGLPLLTYPAARSGLRNVGM